MTIPRCVIHYSRQASPGTRREHGLGSYHVGPPGLMAPCLSQRRPPYATRPESVAPLIPFTDAIVAGGLPGRGQEAWNVVVPFAVAREIAGDAWREAEVPGGPPRLRATGAMSEAQKRALRAAEVALEAVP